MSQNAITVKPIDLTPDGWRFNILSPRIATITAPDGSRKTAYFGFASEAAAIAFRNALIARSLCTRAVVRPSERLTTAWECKAWGISTKLICHLLNRNQLNGFVSSFLLQLLSFIGMPKSSLKSYQLALFDRETSTADRSLSPGTIAAIKALLSMGMDKEFAACLLELAGCCLPHQRYLAGPIITHNSGWQDTIPQWLLEAIPAARLEAIASEIEAGEIGELATPEEALAVMYPATMQAPLSHRWYEVYMYLGDRVLTKYQKLPYGQTFWELTGIDHPITYARVRQDYEELARDIRTRVVKAAAERGVGKRQQKSSKTNPCQPIEGVQPESQMAQQLSLFERSR